MQGKGILYICAWMVGLSYIAYSQQVGIGTMMPDPSAILEVSDTIRGILIPRLSTSERDAIALPADGLIIFNTDRACFETYHATTGQWTSCVEGSAIPFDSADTLYKCMAYGRADGLLNLTPEEVMTAMEIDTGGYVWMAGVTLPFDHLLLLRIKPSLEIDFGRIPSQYQLGGSMGVTSLAHLPNNDMVVGSLTHGYNNPSVSRVRPNGTVVWSKNYDILTPASADVVAIDGSTAIVVAGPTSTDQFILKLDATGDTVWMRLFPYNGQHVVAIRDMIVDTNNEIVAAGSYNGQLMVCKLNGGGDTLWFKTYLDTDSTGAAEGIAVDGVGNIYVAGWVGGVSTSREALLMKLDPDGNILWSSLIGGDLHDEFRDLVLLPGGDIVAVGRTASFPAGRTSHLVRIWGDMYAVRFSSTGIPLWTRTYGGAFDDEARKVYYWDGKLWMAGTTASFGYGNLDMWLVIADPRTGTSCCSSGMGGRRSYVSFEVRRPKPDFVNPGNPTPSDIGSLLNYSVESMSICK